MRINIKALTFSIAIVNCLFFLFLGWAGAFGWGQWLVSVISSIFYGFTPSFIGGILGAFWGFGIGGVTGMLLAYIYNAFRR